jgi:hypothetical protein
MEKVSRATRADKMSALFLPYNPSGKKDTEKIFNINSKVFRVGKGWQ